MTYFMVKRASVLKGRRGDAENEEGEFHSS